MPCSCSTCWCRTSAPHTHGTHTHTPSPLGILGDPQDLAVRTAFALNKFHAPWNLTWSLCEPQVLSSHLNSFSGSHPRPGARPPGQPQAGTSLTSLPHGLVPGAHSSKTANKLLLTVPRVSRLARGEGWISLVNSRAGHPVHRDPGPRC